MTIPEPPPQRPFSPAPPPIGPPLPPGLPYIPLPAGQKRMPGWAIALIIIGAVTMVACIGGSLLLGGAAKSVKDSTDAASADVTISTCTDGGEFVGPQAVLSVTNHGTRTASYIVQVAFESSDGSQQFGTGTASVNHLSPGQTGTANATSFRSDVAPGTDFKCRITSVARI